MKDRPRGARATLAEARARLEQAIRRAAADDFPAPRRARAASLREPDEAQLLEARAASLAAAAQDPRADRRDETEMMAFRLGELRCAIPLASLREVRSMRLITPLPGVPPHILGARGVRGEVLTVVALGRLFGQASPATEGDERLLVVEVEGAAIALAVDAVEGVLAVDLAGLKPPVATAMGAYERHVLGLAPDLSHVLDIAGLLGEPSLAIDLPS